MQARLAEVKAEVARIEQEAERRFEERKGKVVARLEPAHMIRNDLIEKQDALIAMLYDEQSAGDETKKLKAEIDQQWERLENRPFVKHKSGRH